MESVRETPSPTRHRLRTAVWRLAVRVALVLAGAVVGVVVYVVHDVTRGDPLQPWHEMRPRSELVAGRQDAPADLDGYLRLERRLFDEVATEVARRVEVFPAFSRFDPASPTHPARFVRDWNRTFELTPDGPVRGEALVLHGLTDSPYSVRAVAERLAAGGFHVVVPRMPGHGTVPGGLAVATREDWRRVVRIGVAATGGRAAESGVPFVVVGYSNGAALALDYTAQAWLAGDGPVPDRLVFLSPAFAVGGVAAVAPWMQRVSRAPGLARIGWESIHDEFDPFKFNSFPIHAAAEIYELTSELEEGLLRLEEQGGRLPPLLTLQSVVDATIPPVASLTRLYGREQAPGADSELVLFDANRSAGIGGLLRPEADELLALARDGRTFPFRVTLITNAETGGPRVEACTRAAGSRETDCTPLDLDWPAEVYSLSHVAIPFAPDDPAYGVGTSPLGPPFPFGDLEMKGERGVFRISQSLLTRLRYNPFFEVVDAKLAGFLDLHPDEPMDCDPGRCP